MNIVQLIMIILKLSLSIAIQQIEFISMQTKQTNDSILVLGGQGFLGTQICRFFDQQQLSYFNPSSKTLDLTSTESTSQLTNIANSVTQIVFLSAVTPDRNRQPEAQSANIQMIKNVINVFQQSRPLSHLTYISSDAVYGDAEHIDEITATQPNSLYGEMHLTREHLISKLDIPTAIFRPTMLYGKNDTHTSYGISRLINEARVGPINLFGKGEEFRDYIHVEDAAGIISCAVNKKSKGVWNIASGHSTSFLELTKLIEACQDKPLEIKYLERKQAITHKYFDIQSLRDSFPHCAIRNAETGIFQIIEQYNRDIR